MFDEGTLMPPRGKIHHWPGRNEPMNAKFTGGCLSKRLQQTLCRLILYFVLKVVMVS
jgi:hypothetical protein